MIKENLLVLCNDEVREFYNNLKQHSLVLKKDLFDGYISLPDELLCDIFCSFYLENSDIKKRDEINSSSIQNYYLLENILNHYHFKNIRSFVEKHKNDVFLILEIFANEFVKLIQSKKKINEIFKTSKVFFEELKNKHSEDVASQNITKENLVKFKKGLKSITGDLMIEVYKTFNKLKSLLILTRGNDLNPASIIQIPYNEKFVLAEKLSNFKIKEIIKIYTQANLQNK